MTRSGWEQYLRQGVGLIASIPIVIAAALLVVLTVVSVREALAVAFLDSPSTGIAEWNGVLVAAMILLVLPVVLVTERPIEMTFLYGKTAQSVRHFLDVCRQLAIIATFILLASASVPWAIASLEVGERQQGLLVVPIYPIKILFAAGLMVGLGASLFELFALLRGRELPEAKTRVVAE